MSSSGPDLEGFLALRGVERQQRLIELLHVRHGGRVRLDELAARLGVSARTVARDVERLRQSGVPLDVRRGRDGGVRLPPARARLVVELDLPEVAAVLSSLAVLGPSSTVSAESVMRKLVTALQPEVSSG